MATFNFVLREKQNRLGENPIYLRITSNRKHKYISTGVSVKSKDWNPINQEVRRSHDYYKTLNETLKLKRIEVQNAHNELLKQGNESAKAIRERVKTTAKADFFELGEVLYNDYFKARKYYASKTLLVVLKKVEEFHGERELPLKNVDSTFLQGFIEFLRTEYSNNDSTINKNFEPIRKIIQLGIKSYLITSNPIDLIKVPPRRPVEQKTKLTIEQINTIEALNLKPGSWEWNVRNAFLFSFYSGGIRFGDICCLKWSNVKNGKLSYQMNKNKKGFSTELNQYQSNILQQYSGEDNQYIFPFLKNGVDYSDPIELRKAISSNNAQANGKVEPGGETGLKLIARMAGIDENISFHVSRHSFAQYAVSVRGLDVYELMQTLRHSKIETTAKYLKGLSEELADKAMKKVF